MANIRHFHKEALEKLKKRSWDEGGHDPGDYGTMSEKDKEDLVYSIIEQLRQLTYRMDAVITDTSVFYEIGDHVDKIEELLKSYIYSP